MQKVRIGDFFPQLDVGWFALALEWSCKYKPRMKHNRPLKQTLWHLVQVVLLSSWSIQRWNQRMFHLLSSYRWFRWFHPAKLLQAKNYIYGKTECLTNYQFLHAAWRLNCAEFQSICQNPAASTAICPVLQQCIQNATETQLHWMEMPADRYLE